MSDFYEKLKGRERISIKVRPDSPTTEIIGYDSSEEIFSMNVKAHPDKGKANQEIIRFFSRLLKKEVKIVSGVRSKRKLLKLI